MRLGTIQNKLLKLFNILLTVGIAAGLLHCAGMTGLGNRATEDPAGQQSAALDEFGQWQNPGGGDNSGVGSPGGGGPGGPLGGAGGGMTGGGATGGGTDPNPFDDVDAGGGGNVPGGSSSCESTGDTGCTTNPSGFLFGYFTIKASLNADVNSGGGNCNSLWPPEETRTVCQEIDVYSQRGVGPSLEGWLLGTAWALPTGGPGGGKPQTFCSVVTTQPPIDPNLIPKVQFISLNSLYPSQVNMYDKTFTATCSPNGKWTVETPLIEVNLSSSDETKNFWTFNLLASYPENGTWIHKGTKTVVVHCGGDGTGKIVCEDRPFVPRALPAPVTQGTVLNAN